MNNEELALFVDVVIELLGYVEPCDNDPQRPYCVTHHSWNCQSDALGLRLTEMIERYQEGPRDGEE